MRARWPTASKSWAAGRSSAIPRPPPTRPWGSRSSELDILLTAFDKFTPFRYARHDGKGFARNDEVDLEAMKRHYEHSTNGYHAEIAEETLAPADD